MPTPNGRKTFDSGLWNVMGPTRNKGYQCTSTRKFGMLFIFQGLLLRGKVGLQAIKF
jgi:hypothetical protein